MTRILAVLVLLATAGLTFANSPADQHVVSGPGFDPTPVKIDSVTRSKSPRPITPMDLLTLRDLKGTQISPDGKKVVFALVQAVYETNSYRSGLFVVDTTPGSLPVSLGTAGPPRFDEIGQVSDYSLTWSPDGRWITCLTNQNGSWQIWRWAKDGGKPEQLTHNTDGVQEFEWAPDGTGIIFSTSQPMDSAAAKKILESGIVYDGSIRTWGHDTFPRLLLKAKPTVKQTWIYEIQSGRERTATAEEQARLNKRILEQIAPGKYILRSRLSRDGRSQLLVIRDAEGFSIFLKSLTDNTLTQIKPPSQHNIYNLWWSTDEGEIYFEQSGPPAAGLYAISIKGGPIRAVSKSTDVVLGFSFDRSGSKAACIRTNPTLPLQIAMVDLQTGIPTTLVDVNPEFQNIALSPAVRLEWKNKYGIATHAHLVKPLNYEPGKRYPLIVTTYASGGFLRGAAGDEYPIQVFAANGFAVLDFNEPPRPVVTDGDFNKAKMIWDSPMESLATVLKMLDDMGIVQSDKRGLSGLSFGTEITMYTISHSNLFQAAATSQGSGRDPFAYDLAEVAWQKRMSNWGLGGRPEGKAAGHWRELSAALNAERINAPLLIQLSDSELLTSLMLYNSLKELNKPVEMIVYADELHVKNQPKHRYEIYQRNLDWFAFWLQGKENSDPDKRQQYARWRAMKEATNKTQTLAR
jgi:dipeptidyl aminopeptidase/acylaminoacyl peptidase